MAHLLIVDDDGMVCELLEDVLGASGYEVSHAYRAADGWDLFRATAPHAVVVDNRLGKDPLPHETGLALARRIKESSPHTLVIMSSLEPPREARAICDIVFTKPTRATAVRDALAQLGVMPD